MQKKPEAFPTWRYSLFTKPPSDGRREKVTGIRIKDRITNESATILLTVSFVQIGLAANSAHLSGTHWKRHRCENKTDAFRRTTLLGVYAAGDVRRTYKQIIIAMGEGAKAALSALTTVSGIA